MYRCFQMGWLFLSIALFSSRSFDWMVSLSIVNGNRSRFVPYTEISGSVFKKHKYTVTWWGRLSKLVVVDLGWLLKSCRVHTSIAMKLGLWVKHLLISRVTGWRCLQPLHNCWVIINQLTVLRLPPRMVLAYTCQNLQTYIKLHIWNDERFSSLTT